MFSRILFVCLFVALLSGGSSLSCSWMQHKFRDYGDEYLQLLDTMGEHIEVNDAVSFPYDLYSQVFTASAEDKVTFTVQILDEVATVFEEDYSNASWEDKTVKDFVGLVMQQADGLRSCTGRHRRNKKLHMSFKRLTRHVLGRRGHSAESWELIRQEVRNHLIRADQLISSLLN